jgi:membrane protease YdiL (CAAX protease family)
VGFAAIALVLVFFLYQIVAGGIALLLVGGRVTEDNVTLFRGATVLGQLLCLLLPTLLLAKARYGNILRSLRVRLPDVRETIVTVIAVFALQQMAQGYMIFQDAIPLPEPLKHLVEILKKALEETYRVLIQARSPGEFLIVVITVALVPAISEEFLFRGLVQRSFEEAAGGIRAAIIAGIIFGAYHLNPFGLAPLVALGVFFGFIVYRSENILLAVTAHFFNNFIACSAIYFDLNEDFIVLRPGGGATPTIVLADFVLFALVFVAATYYFVHITQREESDSAPQ